MSLKNVTVKSSHGVERLFIRATPAQKKLIEELRNDKDKIIKKEGQEYKLYHNENLIKVLNKETVEVLLSQEFLEYVDRNSNKIHLSIEARR